MKSCEKTSAIPNLSCVLSNAKGQVVHIKFCNRSALSAQPLFAQNLLEQSITFDSDRVTLSHPVTWQFGQNLPPYSIMTEPISLQVFIRLIVTG